MTGLHSGHTPVRGNRGFKPEWQFPLPDTTVTIARRLRDEGYYTADFGKWGLGYPGSSGVPSKQGFDTFYGYNCQSLAHKYYPDHLWQNDQRIELDANKKGAAVYSADLIHGHALEFLRHRKDGPFFLFLSYTLPHAALNVPHDAMYDHYVNKFLEAARDPAVELYDLSRDPAEKNNVAAEHEDVVIRMLRMMEEAHVPDRNWPLFGSEGVRVFFS